MSDIDTAEYADTVDDVVFTRDETLILKELAGELLAKREAQRVRDERNAHIRAQNTRGGAAYKPPEPVAPPQPARSVGLTQIHPDDDWIKTSHRR